MTQRLAERANRRNEMVEKLGEMRALKKEEEEYWREKKKQEE